MKKKILNFIITLLFSQFCLSIFAIEPFRFVLFTDLHISIENPIPSQDLQNSVNEVNKTNGIDFVLVSGDVSENGDSLSLDQAKKILNQLKIPYYITSGNHETKWSESGATDFAKIFGDDKFEFSYKGCKFIGFATGPVIKMGDGHIAPQDLDWTKAELEKSDKNLPTFIITHYPLLNGDVDNYYEMTDLLRNYNIQAVLNGHYHRNVILNYDGIPGIVNRSTLRAKEAVGGYSVYEVSDSIRVYEKKIGFDKYLWLTLPFEVRDFKNTKSALIPSFEVNNSFKNVREVWRVNNRIRIYGIPAVDKSKVFYGDDMGFINALSVYTGKLLWKYKTGNRIISSPAVSNGKLVFGSTDGNIYCLNSKTGSLIWKFETSKAVLGNPVIQNDTVFIGGSDGCFRAIDLNTGSSIWNFCDLKGYVETKPVIAQNKVFFGAWDTYFYALNTSDGSLSWEWNNGNKGRHYSPAAVLAVYSNGKIFITAPDRYWTALNALNGKVVWRTNQHEVRETIGISEDKKTIFSRCMNDSVVAIDAQTNFPKKIWKTNAGYGYDHNPSMLIEKNRIIVFGTKNGLIHGIDAKTGKVLWRHKVGNSIINTVNIISKNKCILTTSEGVVMSLKY